MLTPLQPERAVGRCTDQKRANSPAAGLDARNKGTRICCSLDWTSRNDRDGLREGGEEKSREAARSLAKRRNDEGSIRQ